MQDEESLWGWEETELTQPHLPALAPQTGLGIDTPPAMPLRMPAKSPPPPPSPLWDIEICTLVRTGRKPRASTLASTPRWLAMAPVRARDVECTPPAGDGAKAPYRVGTAHTTVRTPHPLSPLSPQMSLQLLASLELVAMEGDAPPSPRQTLLFEASSQGSPAWTRPHRTPPPRLRRCHAARKDRAASPLHVGWSGGVGWGEDGCGGREP